MSSAETPPESGGVRFFFDFLSPYSALALLRAEEFEREHGVRFSLRPVPLGALLAAFDLRGPGEIEVKRRYIAADVIRLAEAEGLEFVGPPEHPFVSLNALRVATLFLDDPRALGLCAALARAAWVDGLALTDLATCGQIVHAQGLDGTNLDSRIATREVKQRLRGHTTEAVELGVFGVPTFALADGELFHGQDRMDLLARRLRGELASPLPRAATMLSRSPRLEVT